MRMKEQRGSVQARNFQEKPIPQEEGDMKYDNSEVSEVRHGERQ